MKNIIYQSKYIVALARNTMTDAIRNNFISVTEDMDNVLRNAVGGILRSQAYTQTEATAAIAQEYEKLSLFSTFGDYALYQPLFDQLTKAPTALSSTNKWLEYLDDLLTVAFGLDEDIKLGVYYAVLECLVAKDLTMLAMDRVEELTDILEDAELNSKAKLIADIAHDAFVK